MRVPTVAHRLTSSQFTHDDVPMTCQVTVSPFSPVAAKSNGIGIFLHRPVANSQWGWGNSDCGVITDAIRRHEGVACHYIDPPMLIDGYKSGTSSVIQTFLAACCRRSLTRSPWLRCGAVLRVLLSIARCWSTQPTSNTIANHWLMIRLTLFRAQMCAFMFWSPLFTRWWHTSTRTALADLPLSPTQRTISTIVRST